MSPEEHTLRRHVQNNRRAYAEAFAKGDMVTAVAASRRVNYTENKLHALVHGPDVKPWEV